MKRIAIASILMLCSLTFGQAPTLTTDSVPNQQAAIRIAKAALAKKYGRLDVKTQEPFHAELQNNVWIVYGRWQEHPNPNVRGGGGLYMQINKPTGEISKFYFAR
jgi:hypothetical protein